MKALRAKGLKPATIGGIYSVVKSALRGAVKAGHLARHPVTTFQLRDVVKVKREARIEPITPADLDRLAHAVGDDYRAMVYVAGIVGFRWAECAGLRVGAVDLLKRRISVVTTAPRFGGDRAKPKSEASVRTVGLTSKVVDELAAHLHRRGLDASSPDALVFVAPGGGRLWPANFQMRVWTPARAKAGLPNVRWHDLRHAAISWRVAAGIHPKAIQADAGHEFFATTMDTYAKVFADQTDKTAAALDGWLKAAGSPADDASGSHRGHADG